MKRKLKEKIMSAAIAILFLASAYPLIAAGDDTPPGSNDEVSIHIPPIDRGDNGVADIYIHLDPISTKKTHIETPEKIIVTPLSNGKKMKTLDFQDIHMQKDNTIHLHPFDMPDCEKVEITIYLPNNKITKRAIVRQVPKPEKVIHVDSTKSDELPDGITLPDNVTQNIDGVAPLLGWYYVPPPFPDGDSGTDGYTAADAHIDPDTGDGGVFAGSHPYHFSWAYSKVYNTPHGYYLRGMNWLGIQQIGVTIKDGYMYMPWCGVGNYGEVTIKAYEFDENWHYVSNNYHRLWYVSCGTDRDIDVDIDNGAWIIWNPNHYYRGESRVYASAEQTTDPTKASFIDLGEDYGDIDFEYIYWFWYG